MSTFSLDSVDLEVRSFSGFDLPDDVTTVGVLGDGTSAFNAVLQSPGTRLPEAEVVGFSLDPVVIALLQALRQSGAQVAFVTPEGTYTVVVSRFKINRRAPATMLFNYSMSLIALTAPTS